MSRYRHKIAHAKKDTTDAELKRLRGLCHKHFDSGWRDGSHWPTRDAAYIWLQIIMDLSEDKAHISLFDKQQCLKLLGHLIVPRGGNG